MHRVWLMTNGQLVFPDHPDGMKELTRYLNLTELGGEHCACADMWDLFRQGEIMALPKVLARERQHPGHGYYLHNLPWRIRRRYSKLVRWPLSEPAEPLLPDIDENGKQTKPDFYKRVVYAVVVELRRRGHHVVAKDNYTTLRLLGKTDKDEVTLLRFTYSGGDGFFTVHALGNILSSSTICGRNITADESKNPPVTFLVECVERLLIGLLLHKAIHRNEDKWETRCEASVRLAETNHGVPHLTIVPTASYATGGFDLKLTDLTPQAIRLCVRELSRLGGKLTAIRKASAIRLDNPNRFPGVPGNGFGKGEV
jgi:hypothetical protein